MKAYLKLRVNIELVGDLVLAEREINYLCDSFIAVTRDNLKINVNQEFSEQLLLKNARKDDTIGYLVSIKDNCLNDLIHKTSFIQEIWIPKSESLPRETKESKFYKSTSSNFHFFLPLLAAGEFLSFYKGKIKAEVTFKKLINYLADFEHDALMQKAVNRSMTSTLHVHGMHKYKAKFFPRMIRSLLLTEGGEYKNPTVLDPFVGSGTTLVEASFFGYDSVGVDIDGLSCHISKSKIELLKTSTETITKETATFLENENLSNREYHFPSWISRKFQRWDTVNEQLEYESQISAQINRSENLNGTKAIFKTAISDAISRKFNIRMMGTGVGRFALEIQKTALETLITQNVKQISHVTQVLSALQDSYNINLAQSQIVEGDAKDLHIASNSINLIITSPPYLPASSGRENYLIGKSISITALDILSEQEIKQKEIESLGAMTSSKPERENGLPDKVYKLYDFLINDELRKIKADPTYSYYLGLKKALQESFRVLTPDGKAIYIIGKESVFYTFKTREVLHRVECDKIFEEIAISVGFKILNKIDLELNKKNRNARPRGLDSYYESVFILKK